MNEEGFEGTCRIESQKYMRMFNDEYSQIKLEKDKDGKLLF